MMGLFEYVGVANAVFGLIITVFSVGAALVAWMHLKMKSVATDVVKQADSSHASTERRVGALENTVSGLSNDVQGLKQEVHGVGERVTKVEMSMQTVARQSDIAKLGREVSSLRSAFDTQTNTLTAQIAMLYQKAVDIGGGN